MFAKVSSRFNSALKKMEESVDVILQFKLEQHRQGIKEGEHGKDLLDLMLEETDPTTGEAMSMVNVQSYANTSSNPLFIA